MGEHLREQRDEGGADDGSRDAAEPADDDHGEVFEGQDHAEVLGHGPLEDQGEQDARETGVHGGEDEDPGPVAGHRYAHDACRDPVVADGVHRPAGPAPQHAPGEQGAQQQSAEPQVPELLRRAERDGGDQEFGVVEGEPEEGERRYGPPVVTPGQGARVEQDVLPDEDQGEGGDTEVGPAQPSRDRAEHPSGEAREEDGEDGGQPGGQSEPGQGVAVLGGGLPRQDAVAVRADGEEEGVAHGELAGGSGEHVEPDGTDRRRHREQPGLEPEAVQVEGEDEEQEGAEEDGVRTRSAQPFVEAWRANRLGGGRSCCSGGGDGGVRHGPAPSCRRVRPAGSAGPRPSPGRAPGPRCPGRGRRGRSGSRWRAPR